MHNLFWELFPKFWLFGSSKILFEGFLLYLQVVWVLLANNCHRSGNVWKALSYCPKLSCKLAMVDSVSSIFLNSSSDEIHNKLRSSALHIFQNGYTFFQIGCSYYLSILKMCSYEGSGYFSELLRISPTIAFVCLTSTEFFFMMKCVLLSVAYVIKFSQRQDMTIFWVKRKKPFLRPFLQWIYVWLQLKAVLLGGYLSENLRIICEDISITFYKFRLVIYYIYNKKYWPHDTTSGDST